MRFYNGSSGHRVGKCHLLATQKRTERNHPVHFSPIQDLGRAVWLLRARVALVAAPAESGIAMSAAIILPISVKQDMG